MSAALAIATEAAELSAITRFREAEHASIAGKPCDLDEMIAECLAERDQVERSARAAETAYGVSYHPTIVRRCVVLQRVAELLGRIAQHKDEIGAILKGGAAPAKRRRA